MLLLVNNSLFLLLLPQVVKRGMAPGGGGEVVFTCPVRRTVRPVLLTDPGKIKRIRGVAYPSQAHSHNPFSSLNKTKSLLTVQSHCIVPVRAVIIKIINHFM